MYGFRVLKNLFVGDNENWAITPRFPRVTWCNFAVRNMADNIHEYTVQCSLPINLFNEKIFLIIWFWLYFTTLCTLFGFLYWICSLFYPKLYENHLLRYLRSMKRIHLHHAHMYSNGHSVIGHSNNHFSKTLTSNIDLERIWNMKVSTNLKTKIISNDDQRSSTTALTHTDEILFTDFTMKYLGRDGILVLYIINKNSNEVITGELVSVLWDLYRARNR
ncbi:unnamed protein product [Didymodactylos carnosus]|nr:unnamed protein product [Didymodactylos carnosus]CAF0800084.1 unnamed protein product [Didymodactylos carnosus]CAF3507003.1 unnamed protein product [Didymodactylos carnosus]CAF3585031.1 unnamed protein product [Didymodactylos carnosus]